MTEKRFSMKGSTILENNEEITAWDCCDLLNELHEENMNLRAKNTKFVIILKDVVNDLKRMNTYRYAEHLEKIANIHFLSEELNVDD